MLTGTRRKEVVVPGVLGIVLSLCVGCGGAGSDVEPKLAACDLVVRGDSYGASFETSYIEPVDPGVYYVLVCGQFLRVDGVDTLTDGGCRSWERSVEDGNPGIVCYAESLNTYSDGTTSFHEQGWEEVYILWETTE